MKRFNLLLGILFLSLFSVCAQEIKEIDGVYYKGDTPYSGTYTTNFDNGKSRITIDLIDGLKDGEVKVFFENGDLNEIRSYKRNIMDGTWLTFNKNKVKIAEAHYLNGKKDGKWLIWDENGKLIYELEYTLGEKTGIWRKYDNSGTLIEERNYPALGNGNN